MSHRRAFLLAMPACAALCGTRAFGQPAYPDRAVRIVVPFGPGSATDVIARKLSSALNGVWSAPVVVENKPGAAGAIATDLVAKSNPDGYTLLVTSSTHYTTPWLEKTPYDAVGDFTVVARLANTPLILVTAASGPLRDVADVIRAARRAPGSVTFGSSGEGSPSHMCGALLNRRAGIAMVHAPYKNSSQVLVDTANRQVDLAFAGPAALPLVNAGRLRVLAVTSARRSTYLPAVPTVNESGAIDGYAFVSPVWAFAPAATRDAVLSRLSDAFSAIVASADFKRFCAAQYLEPDFQPAVAAQAAARAEAAKWQRLVELTRA